MAIKLGIIDSGVYISHPYFKNSKIKGYALDFNEHNKIIKKKDFNDEIGHGTAIFSIINDLINNAEIVKSN